ncbi:hypothetical protein BDZ89DRAFT_834981 [Hymenopellis radicata]|nr:hypothetical protein BDZ89DRAFT_834981 [Hymenopellis radicata]
MALSLAVENITNTNFKTLLSTFAQPTEYPRTLKGKTLRPSLTVSRLRSLVDAALRRFQEERKVLHDAVQRFTQLKSSRRRLPPEVLCEIFRTACRDVYEPDDEEFEEDDEDDETHDDDDEGDEKGGGLSRSRSKTGALREA